MNKLQELLDARNQALTECRSYVDKKETSPEDETNYQRAFADFERLDRRVADEKAFMKAEADAAESRAKIEDIIRPKEVRKQEDHYQAEIREFVTHGSDRRGLWIPVPESRVNTGAIVSDDGGANAYGQYTVPEQWYNTVQMHVNAQSGVLACNCTVINTTTGNEINIPYLGTDASAVAGVEAVAATETKPVFTQPVLNAYRVDGFFTVSKEFLQDTAINSEAFLREAAARAIATKVAAYAASGTGSGQPAGLNYTTEPTTAGKTAAAQTTFTSDEIMDLYLSVLDGYRQRGEFVAGDTAYGIMLKWKDDEGRYLITNPTATENATFMGKPIHSDAGYQATTTGLCPVTFGDMSQFWVRWARGLEFTRDDSAQFTLFASTFRFAAWFDCVLLETTAVKHLLMA